MDTSLAAPPEQPTDAPATHGSSVRPLGPAECWALAEEAEIGRLAVIRSGYPEIFPVNFAIDGRSVVIQTARGTKLDSALTGPVCFEVDAFDPAAAEAWSVVITGTGQRITDSAEAAAVRPLLRSWHEGRKPYLVRIVPEWVTGRRFPVAPAVGRRLE